MRDTNSGTAFYSAGIVPTDPAQLPRFVGEELRKIEACLRLLAAGHLDKTYAEPTKFGDGDIRYADGTTWKPNGTGGVGIWYYNSTSGLWIQLG